MRRPPHPTSPSRGPRALIALERVLLAAGLLCSALYVGACAQLEVTQRHASRAFDRTLAAHLAVEQHDLREWDARRVARFEASRKVEVSPLARLDIPDADVSVMVLEGTGDRVLDRAVGRIEGTAAVGRAGNLGIAGHRDGIFRGLRHLQVGDALTLTHLDGVGHYVVESLRVVRPRNVEVLDPTPHKSLTLVTCYPFYFVGDAPERFIVHAREVRFEAWSDTHLPQVAAR